MATIPKKPAATESLLPGPQVAADSPTPLAESSHPGNESVVVQGEITADVSLAVDGEQEFDRSAYLAEVERIRAMRKPFGAFTLKLALPQRRGYKRHWFNDVPGRVEQKLSEGWSHIKDKVGSPLKRVVGAGRDNNALLAYAMEIPEVIWLEEQTSFHKAAQARIDDIQAHPVRAPRGTSQKSDQGKFYSPNEDMVRVIEDPVPRSVI
jgi:hypothetical protein